MSNQEEEEQVKLALQGFRNAVRKFCRKCTGNPKDEIPRHIQAILDHADVCITTLTQKRRSLQQGFSYLQTDLWPKQILVAFQQASSSSRRRDILYHFLEHCLRLHDGLPLLVSGECRHMADIRQAKRTKYPSLLATQAPRADGYTSVYKSPGGYSGCGWDEFFDPLVGIKRRLLDALQNLFGKYKRKRKAHNNIWDSLLSYGGEGLEAQMNHHESEMNLLEQGFNTLRDKVVRDLKATIAPGSAQSTAVTFVFHDKLEKLVYGEISLERRADAFQMKDPKGVLPIGYSKKDWSKIMNLPTQHQKPTTKTATVPSVVNGNKKRRIIDDDSSDDDDDDDDKKITSKAPINKSKNIGQKKSQQKVPSKTQSTSKNNNSNAPMTPVPKSSSSGLTVKVAKAKKKPTTPGEGTSMSVAQIKVQMGVDQNALEAGREELEKEEAGASKAAKAEEAEAEAITSSSKEGEISIQRQRRVLTRALNRKGNMADMNEVWDAREVLRELLMTVGNQILEEIDGVGSRSQQDTKGALLVAYNHFKEASEVVAKQDEYRRKLKAKNLHSKLEDIRLSRNCLYLAGNASTNMGRTSIELATQSKRNPSSRTEATQHLRSAVQHLKTAVEYAGSLRERSMRDTQTWNCDALETTVDAIRADQLESLAKRWWGTALWHQGKKKEAWQQFKSASSLFSATVQKFEEMAGEHKAIHSELCELGLSCLSAPKSFIVLASDELNGLSRGAAEEGDLLLSTIKESSKNACDVVDSIHKFLWSMPSEDWTCEEFLEEKTNIQQTLQDTEGWWKTQKAKRSHPTAVASLTTDRGSIPLPRSDLEQLGLVGMPTRRFTVDDGVASRRKKKRRGANPMYHQKSGELLSAAPLIDEPQRGASKASEPKAYRPWGDELLPQVVDETTGRSVSKLEYPCIAPTMPPEVKAFLEAA